MKANVNVYMKRAVLDRTPHRLLQFMKKRYYSRRLSRPGWREPEMEMISSLVSPGDRVIDVGANVGFYTHFLASLVGGEGKVFSLEPVASTFEILSFAVRKRGLANVSCINSAASDVSGPATMEVPSYEWGGRNFYRARITEGGGGLPVYMRTLDGLFKKERGISFIKCDTEGHEVKCFSGARELVASSLPALFVEINDGFGKGSRGETLAGLLEPQGYRAYAPRNGRLYPAGADSEGPNYFFLTQKHLQRCARFIPQEDRR